jgi:hypothetical protein
MHTSRGAYITLEVLSVEKRVTLKIAVILNISIITISIISIMTVSMIAILVARIDIIQV